MACWLFVRFRSPNHVWGNNVKFAVPTENFASECNDVTYYCHEVNKVHEDVWLVYPWENVGEYA